MIDPDKILAEFSLAPEPAAPQTKALATVTAERHRGALVAKLNVARASIDILISLVMLHPEAEEAFATQTRHLGACLNDAGDDAIRLSGMIECRGEA